MGLAPWIILGTITLVGLVLAWRPLRILGRNIQIERARELYSLQRERLEAVFVSAAASTGKPRGLRWVGCTFEKEVEMARDRFSGQLVGLVPVTIQFEAIPGSDMEGLPAVANLRVGSAVFYFQKGQWHTTGKAVFNLSPSEAIAHFQKQYERIE